MSIFTKATRKKTKLRLALSGPSGAGKTLSALRIAVGLYPNKKDLVIGLVDTENGSSELYSDRYEFHVAKMNPPYEVKKYLRAIEEAEKAGVDVLIIDSLTHAWAGEGGLLDKKTALDSRGGNQFTNWGPITKEHEALKSKILHNKTDLIVTMRSKTEYVLHDQGGKQVPKKMGMAPIQREGMEYEFDVWFDLDAKTHSAIAQKDRTGLFDGRIIEPLCEETGKELRAWLTGPLSPETPPPKSEDDEKRVTFGRDLLWKGCHVPRPDASGTDVVAMASSALEERLKEDFYLARLDSELRPWVLVWSRNPREVRHLGIVFDLEIPNAELARSLTGKVFKRDRNRTRIKLQELVRPTELHARMASAGGELQLESWSRDLLDHEVRRGGGVSQ